MIPTKEEAEKLLQEAENCNPGLWGNHSRVAAHCAVKISLNCKTLDPNKAYVLGLLHDIGRRFGSRHLGHVSDGYTYMMSLGYDKLIQLCDFLAGSKGVLDIEERMEDVKRRYGSYPEGKWNTNMELKKYFEKKTGKNIYEVVEKDTYRL